MASFLLNPTLILGLLAARSLAAPAPSSENSYVAKRATATLSCWDNASNGQTFTAKNAEWEVLCGKDYAGGDMSASSAASFEECINDCDTTQGCVDVSFVWPNSCYKKNKLTTAVDNGSVWTARKKVTASTGGTSTDTKNTDTKTPATQDVTCQDKASDGVKYTSKKGTFLVECGFDHYGGDMGSSSKDTFAACIEDCAATEGCVDISYVWGTCYKKNTLNDGGPAGHVWSAKLITSGTDSTGTSPDTKTDTKTDTTKVTPITCPASNGKTPSISSGGTYEITCGTDYWGGDFKSLETASFDLCLEACDKNDACQAVSFVAPSCYLKNEVNKSGAAAHVWGAIVKKAAKDVFTFPTVVNKELEAGATESVMAEVMTLPSPPLATLGPVAPPGIDMGGLGVLSPAKVSELWFGGNADAMKDEDSGAVTVRLTVDYKYPSIVLDHSVYIKNADCASGSLQAKFDNLLAFSHAADTWPAKVPLLFITSAKSCGNGEQNSFWLARSVTFNMNANTFSASGTAVELADVYNEMDIDFGKIEQRNSTSNSTSSADEDTSSCGKPGSPFLDNLPAVACGTSFDRALDEKLGYYAGNGDDEQHVLASAGVDVSDNVDVGVKSDLSKRGWLSNAFKKIAPKFVQVVVKAAVAVVKQVAQTVVQVAKAAAQVAVAVVKTTVQVGIALAVNAAKLVVFVATGNYSNSLTLPIDLGSGTSLTKTTPWEGTTGFKFYDYRPEREGSKWKTSKVNLAKVASEFKLLPGEKDPEPGIELWCVDCGVKGKFVATGSISATPLSGLKKAQVGVHGNMYVGAFLGLNAFTSYEKTLRKDLFVKGLPGWEIPKIVSLGPRVILGAQATFSIEAEGQLLTGASLNWPAFEATLDFVDQSKSSQSGWTPEVTTKFDAHGSLSAKAALGLPVTLSFGINVLDGKFEKAVNLTDIPAITAEAKLEFDVGTSKTQFGGDDCEGIAWDIALTNELRIDVPNSSGWKLKEWKSPALAKGCIGRTRPEEPVSSTAVATSSSVLATSTKSTPTPTPTPTSLQCPAANGKTFTDISANKNQYTIACDRDASGSDITYVALNTFDDCLNYCGTLPDCVGVAWGPTIKICWAKNAWATQTVVQSNQEPRHIAFIPKPTTLQCPDANGKTFTDSGSNKNDYTITCGKDAPGADITWGKRNSFDDCINWCGTVSTCVGVVWGPRRTDGVNCWLKSGWPAQTNNPSPSTDPLHNAMISQPSLSILSMFYADRDITSYAKSNVARGSQLVIDTNNIVGWANGDPWPGNQKSISMLYSYGKELRTFVVAGGTGTFTINPGPASAQPYTQVVPGYEQMSGVSNINIVAIAYGRNAITSRSVYQNMYNAIRNSGGRWQYTNENFQQDTWVGIGKTGVIWYRNLDNGGYLVSNPAREGNYNFFRDARWSKRQEIEATQTQTEPEEKVPGFSPAQNNATPDSSAPTALVAASDASSQVSTVASTATTASQTSQSETSATPSATSTSFPQLTLSNSTTNATSNATDVNFINFEIVDMTNSFKLNPSTSGNLFLSLVGDSTDISNLTSGSFTGDSSTKTIMGDSSDRHLHYYPEVLASSGASRLRLAAWDKLPKGAKLITLSQIEVEGETMMLAIDTKGSYLWPFVCGIKGQLNKIFLVGDPVNGGAALQKDNMKFTVTGGEAYSCEPVALKVKA
ncbi:hypothetical protein EKO04_001397 [Ascochyta lentis]|uniref:Apple domain-containing protein n=1 Tax=Ascochyta lentis TaxID=205686 RepID=A0A8H7JBV7_9PLEO|nr:hypothetical protein EKO04_001397 [Ascochyta lentis]